MAGHVNDEADADPFDLQRFVDVQRASYSEVLAEIRSGHKRSHWMWFIFPQLAGLGSSAMSRRYALKSVGEASAYLAHRVLGPRLVECAEALLGVDGRSAVEILGTPDDIKLGSSATLFALVSPPESVFHRLLDRYFAGRPDDLTVQLASKSQVGP